ncbi:hypothetical protein [Solidesulfovibrio alcoholivorans]|uniref:hypothetical protein n=1 Tax=Solidesulfovibrio alcoholivorans TaxID=81406 RepID=UPI0012EC5E16|nr:hypothetical protein [Solidesulfovibrio alcoholivorans]
MDAQEAFAQVKLLESENTFVTKLEVVTLLEKYGIPLEITTRLLSLWDVSKEIGSKLVNIGKLIIFRIVEFIQRNPNMAIGMALGACLGALVNLVPFIGPLLSPIATAVMAFYGAVIGHSLDLQSNTSNIFAIAIDAAKEFFQLIVDIILTLKISFEEN